MPRDVGLLGERPEGVFEPQPSDDHQLVTVAKLLREAGVGGEEAVDVLPVVHAACEEHVLALDRRPGFGARRLVLRCDSPAVGSRARLRRR